MKESQLENKTSIATNDYVRMVDENGNSVKIKKDSFMAAIRDALPSIISDGETGGGSVLSIINGALKSRTDANLASVLGVNTFLFADAQTSEAIDNIPLDGIVRLYTFGSSDITGGLGLHYGVVLDCSSIHRRFQVLVASDGAATRGGDRSGWYSWYRIDNQ